MGWLDNLWRRRAGRVTETAEERARARGEEQERRKAERDEADLLEERAHLHRDEQIFREPRKPPGTG